MKSRNNMMEKQAHFAIKKLSMGAAAVLVSTSMYLGLKSGNVLADTTADPSTTEEVMGDDNGAKDETVPQADANADKVPATQSDKDVSINDNKITNPEKDGTNKSSTQDNQKTTPVQENDDKQAKSNSKADTSLTGAPQYTVQGQEPVLNVDELFSQEQLDNMGIDKNDEGTSIVWAKLPDVSKIGDTTGTAKLTYEDMNADPTEDGDVPSKSVMVTVPVLVRKADQEVKENQVVNSINVVNTDNNSLVAHYDWVGNKGDDTENIPNRDAVESNFLSIFKYLGFDTDDVEFPENLMTFGETNKNVTLFVKPVSTTPIIADPPYFNNTNGNSTIDNVNRKPDAYNYIGNLGALPAGTKIEWNVEPQYDYGKDEDGNYTSFEPTNDPSIKVTIPGQAPIILGGETLKDYAGLPAYGDGTLLINPNNQLEVGETAKDPLLYVTNLGQYIKEYFAANGEDLTPDAMKDFAKSFHWTIAPNTNLPGYTIGVFDFGNGPVGAMILFKVVESTTGEPTEQPSIPQESTENPDKQPQTPNDNPDKQPQTPTENPDKQPHTPTDNPDKQPQKSSKPSKDSNYSDTHSNEIQSNNNAKVLSATGKGQTNTNSKAILPKTGSRKDALVAIGLGVSMMASIISLFAFKKKEN